jgi:hypothetical protein
MYKLQTFGMVSFRGMLRQKISTYVSLMPDCIISNIDYNPHYQIMKIILRVDFIKVQNREFCILISLYIFATYYFMNFLDDHEEF